MLKALIKSYQDIREVSTYQEKCEYFLNIYLHFTHLSMFDFL